MTKKRQKLVRYEVSWHKLLRNLEAVRVVLSKSHAMPDGNPVERRVNKVGGRKLADRIEWGGLNISIEHRPGDLRQWGPRADQVTRMRHAYGYVRGSVGADGEHHDVFVGTGTPEDSPHVYIFDTLKSPGYTELDEQKTMLGFPSQKAARRALDMHYTDAERRIGRCRSMPLPVFRHKVLRTTEDRPLIRSYRIVDLKKHKYRSRKKGSRRSRT